MNKSGFVHKAFSNLANSLVGKQRKRPKEHPYHRRHPVTQEDLLHLRRTGRYVPLSQTISRNKKIFFFAKLAAPILLPIMFLEKQIIEPIANLLERADLFKIFEKLGFLVAVVVFLLDISVRKENSIYQAWQVVKDGKGEKSGVVVLAVERLKKNDFSLSGIDVEGTNLQGTNLSAANLSRASLKEADLREADLREADLSRADLREADLSKTDLREADLSRANLSKADLREADLSRANLNGAILWNADLSRANLNEADFRGAILIRANLSETDLSGANLNGANFIDAKLCETILPNHKKVNINCNKGWYWEE